MDYQKDVCPDCGNDTFITTETILAKYIFEEKRFECIGDDSCGGIQDNNIYTCDQCGAEVDFEKSEKQGKIILIKEK